MDERVTKLSTMGSEITMRDRLIELINNYPCISTAEDCFMESISADLADYLLANGVIVLPCIVQHGGTHIKLGVNSEGKVIAESVFFSKEEAEEALRKAVRGDG